MQIVAAALPLDGAHWSSSMQPRQSCSDITVHSGFYSAYHNTTLRDGVINGIQKTREAYDNIPIMVTGHSMGGAMASFCALDLIVSANICLKKICFHLFRSFSTFHECILLLNSTTS
ncbi:hypothetical protein VPH35_002954 [Triticum aestivum]